jgi:hypothetical protein
MTLAGIEDLSPAEDVSHGMFGEEMGDPLGRKDHSCGSHAAPSSRPNRLPFHPWYKLPSGGAARISADKHRSLATTLSISRDPKGLGGSSNCSMGLAPPNSLGWRQGEAFGITHGLLAPRMPRSVVPPRRGTRAGPRTRNEVRERFRHPHAHEQQMSKREGCPGLGIWVW